MHLLSNDDPAVPYQKDRLLVIQDTEVRRPSAVTQLRIDLSSITFTDSGYSWVVLVALLVSNLLTGGYGRDFGIITNKIMETHSDATSELVGLIVGVFTGFSVLCTPIISGIINIYGPRTSIFLGTIFIFVGLLISSKVSTVFLLIFTLSAMTGFGTCLIESAQVVVIADYFETKLSIANGIRVCGKALGGILFPAFLVQLFENFGLKQSYLLIAATLFHTMLVAVIVQPLDVHRKLHFLKYVSARFGEASQYQLNRALRAMEGVLKSPSYASEKKFLEFSVLKEPRFVLYLGVTTGVSCAIPLVPIYLPLYATSIGLTGMEGSLILTALSICDLFIRLLIGAIINGKYTNKAAFIASCLLVGGLSTVVIPETNDLRSLTLASCFFSLAYSSYLEFVNVLLCDAFGKEFIASIWGFSQCAMGIANLSVSFIIGHVSSSGDFKTPFRIMGSGLLIASALLFFESIFYRGRRKEYTPL